VDFAIYGRFSDNNQDIRHFPSFENSRSQKIYFLIMGREEVYMSTLLTLFEGCAKM